MFPDHVSRVTNTPLRPFPFPPSLIRCPNENGAPCLHTADMLPMGSAAVSNKCTEQIIPHFSLVLSYQIGISQIALPALLLFTPLLLSRASA